MNIISEFQGEYRFLSNFWPCVVEYDNLFYPSAEHAYQAAKSLDPYIRKLISVIGSADEAKKMGGQISLREDWTEIRINIMKRIVMDKYFRNTILQAKLIGTEDAELIEGNNWNDTFWGVCNGIGENNLGKILMEIRKTLK